MTEEIRNYQTATPTPFSMQAWWSRDGHKGDAREKKQLWAPSYSLIFGVLRSRIFISNIDKPTNGTQLIHTYLSNIAKIVHWFVQVTDPLF